MGGEALPDPVALLLVSVSTAQAPAPPVPPAVLGGEITKLLKSSLKIDFRLIGLSQFFQNRQKNHC